MPEPRDRLVRAVGTGEPMMEVEMGRGSHRDVLRELAVRSEARRGFYFQGSRGRGQRRAEGKENIMPGRSVSTARRGSPLPVWYPRTPLRDITAIVNAVERRRASLRLAARQRRQSSELPSPPALRDSPLDHLTRVADKTPAPSGKASTSSPLTAVVSPAAVEGSPRTPCVPTTSETTADSSKLLELEMKLEKSIEVIEKAVKENLKRTPKVKNGVEVTRLKSLRSMR
ncbi:unnamed protein product [Spirodela intermedia]|uniref:Uncharacterized protein n=2 Tax=Spirodela intermedia TaxID=51605 RepID=A0A7I8JRB8_SPIIN|nr:unnamed protein product [Spirodela intermedia]CAA6672321.1 unnamed protein product [Spirodela intermedia]CAA7409504.1 unnamed protein product [Spirodela intermedia]